MREKSSIVYWDQKWEIASREEILQHQWEKLMECLRYLSERSPFYRKKFAEAGLDVSSIRELQDFKRQVPFTTKEEIRAERERTKDPYGGLLCVPPEEVVHLCRTAGTTGVPSLYGLTRKDVDTLGQLTARCWYQIGARKGHTVACATMGGWNNFSKALVEGLRVTGINHYHFGMPIAGEEIFPIEVLPQWLQIQGFYLSARPLMQVTEKYGARLRELLPRLEYLFVAGQHLTEAFSKGMELLWGCAVYEAYPMTDAGMPSAPCTEQRETFHFAEDAFLVEVMDPETGDDLTGSGKVGEFVVTSLLAEGTPLLRFRTEDIGFSVVERCACGRTGMRLGVSERLAHAVLVGRRAIFAHEVEEVLYGFNELLFLPYHLVKNRAQPQDRLMVRVQRPGGSISETSLGETVTERLSQVLGVEAHVEFISKGDERFLVGYKTLHVVTE